MATLDISRTAVALSESELGVIAGLLTRPDDPALDAPEAASTVADLRRAGLVDERRRVTGVVARLVEVMVAPKLHIVIERFVAERTVVAHIWATETRATVAHEVGGGRLELTPVEPVLVAWEILRIVGLGARPQPSQREPLRVPAAALQAAIDRLMAGDDSGAEAALAAVGGDAARLLELLRARRSSWRATSTWVDPEAGEQIASVAVVDGGESGVWLSRHEGDQAQPIVVLEPVPASVVWDAIVRLLPAPPTDDDVGAARSEEPR